jgi:hypothetical protein
MSEPRRFRTFLAELDAELDGRRRYRQRIVAELATHFDDLVEAEDPGRTALAEALERFGTAQEIAAQFNDIHQARVQRRVRALAVLSCCLAILAAPSLLTASREHSSSVYSLASGRPDPGFGMVVVDPATGRPLGRIYGRRP